MNSAERSKVWDVMTPRSHPLGLLAQPLPSGAYYEAIALYLEPSPVKVSAKGRFFEVEIPV